MDFLQNHIESLIFCSEKPSKVADIKTCLSEMYDTNVAEGDIFNAINRLEKKYQSEDFSFQLYRQGGGYQFLTKPAYHASTSIMLKQLSKKKLSNSALETLSIIAYKQPVTRTQIESIRGVNCDYAIQKLLEKGLIAIMGKTDTVGKPLLYGSSERFMEYFGLNNINELPTPKDFSQDSNTVGEALEN